MLPFFPHLPLPGSRLSRGWRCEDLQQKQHIIWSLWRIEPCMQWGRQTMWKPASRWNSGCSQDFWKPRTLAEQSHSGMHGGPRCKSQICKRPEV